MAKFTYRGRSPEDFKEMPPEEFRQLVPSRVRRALKRGFTEDQKKFMDKVRRSPNGFLKTKSRDLVITPELVGMKLGVHNGKEYVRLEIKPEMFGHRLGEFVLTRKPVKHSAPGFGATKSSKFVPLK